MKTKLIFFLACMLLLPICACDDDDKKNSETAPLVGTKWKLTGFVDETGTKTPEPSNCEDCYVLKFNTDGTINGKTSTNEVFGKYSLNNSTFELNIIQFGGTTMINELYDGQKYINAMHNISSFRIDNNELKLYYGESSYLLFKSK